MFDRVDNDDIVSAKWLIDKGCLALFPVNTIVRHCQSPLSVSIKDYFRKCDQFCRKLRIWSH